MIRIVVADDHPIVRAGLVGILDAADDMCIAGTAASGPEAVAAAAAYQPDVVLMDLRMPGADGAEATARIMRESPGVRVVILTTYESDDAILGAIGAGASGYLLKAAPVDELLAGIRAVAAGEVALAPSVGRTLVRHAAQPPAPALLTAREVEVLRLVADGLTNREIGVRIRLGEATVKTHLVKAFAKLDATSRAHAVTRARDLGLL